MLLLFNTASIDTTVLPTHQTY